MKKDRKLANYLTKEDRDNAPILFQDIKKIFAEKKIDRVFTHDLVKYLCELPESRWSSCFDVNDVKTSGRYISKLLNIYGIHSLILRINKGRLRGYERGHFETLDPLSYDFLQWLHNDWESCYISWSDMHERMQKWIVLPEEKTLEIIKELETHGWLKPNAPKMNFSKGEYEKLWRIRSKYERKQDRKRYKTVGGIIQSATTIKPTIIVCSKPLGNWEDCREPKQPESLPEPGEFNTSGLKKGGYSNANSKFKKYMDEVRTIPASQKITEKFLPAIHEIFEKRPNTIPQYLDIDILVCKMLEAHGDAVELEYHERLEANRARHYNHTTILIMLGVLLGSFAYWVGTMVGG